MRGKPPTLRLRAPASPRRAVTLGLAAALSVFLLAPPTAALIYVGTDPVDFVWSPASGPVAGYQVLVAFNGKPPGAEYARVTGTRVTVAGKEGDTAVVYVRAFDKADNYGERSPLSEPIVFADPPVVDPGPGATLASGVRFDFDGDGRADMLWSHVRTGAVELWRMNGPRRIGLDSLDPVPVAWQVAFSGDFDGDGRADLVWRDGEAGENDVWLMGGAEVLEDAALPPIPADWLPVGSGDFDGDGRDDLLWEQRDSGDLELWLMNGIQRLAASGSIAAPGGDWYASCVADFDGDGRADIFYREVETGENQVWRMNGRSVIRVDAAAVMSGDWSVAGCGDYDGDGRSDVLWRHEKTERVASRTPFWGSSGAVKVEELSLWLMDGHVRVARGLRESAEPGLRVVASGDYDGDGKLEILWRDGSSGANQLWLTDGHEVEVWSAPVAGGAWNLASRDWYDADRRSQGRPGEPPATGGESPPPAIEDPQPPQTEQPAGGLRGSRGIWW